MKYKRYFLLASVLLLASALFFACKHGTGGNPTIPVPGGEKAKGLPRDGSFLQVPAKNDGTVKAFWMCEHEVTQEEYKEVIGSTPSKFKSNPADGEIQEKRPVDHVSWLTAINYCNERSEKEGLEKCYTINGNLSTCDFTKSGYRLPTKEEWEHAARAGIEGNLPYSGAEAPSDTNKDDYAWHDGNSAGKTHEVMKKKPNKWGFYDMSGNVAELIWSDKTKSSYQTDVLGGNYERGFSEGLVTSGAVDYNNGDGAIYKSNGFRVCRKVTE